MDCVSLIYVMIVLDMLLMVMTMYVSLSQGSKGVTGERMDVQAREVMAVVLMLFALSHKVLFFFST